jgi:hypothetical protein
MQGMIHGVESFKSIAFAIVARAARSRFDGLSRARAGLPWSIPLSRFVRNEPCAARGIPGKLRNASV